MKFHIDIGITGTRKGLNQLQIDAITEKFSGAANSNLHEVYHLHHGDCIGADTNIVNIAKSIGGFYIVSHPPTNKIYRAFNESDRVWKEKPYLSRNGDIVDVCDILLVFPFENEPQSRGGTWYTYRNALKKNKPIIIYYPSGKIEEINCKSLE